MDIELATKGIAVLKRCRQEHYEGDLYGGCRCPAAGLFTDAKCNCGAEQLNKEIDETIQKLEAWLHAHQA